MKFFAVSKFNCELVFPFCSDGQEHLFEKHEFNLTQYIDECRNKFHLTPDPYYITRSFGGRNVNAASNIIFSNGMRDPLAPGGVLDKVNDKVHIIKLAKACHHEDLHFKGPNDPPELLAVREEEVKIIQNWIQNFKAKAL